MQSKSLLLYNFLCLRILTSSTPRLRNTRWWWWLMTVGITYICTANSLSRVLFHSNCKLLVGYINTKYIHTNMQQLLCVYIKVCTANSVTILLLINFPINSTHYMNLITSHHMPTPITSFLSTASCTASVLVHNTLLHTFYRVSEQGQGEWRSHSHTWIYNIQKSLSLPTAIELLLNQLLL